MIGWLDRTGERNGDGLTCVRGGMDGACTLEKRITGVWLAMQETHRGRGQVVLRPLEGRGEGDLGGASLA